MACADERVGLIAIKRVSAVAATEGICAASADEDVALGPAIDPVIAPPAVDAEENILMRLAKLNINTIVTLARFDQDLAQSGGRAPADDNSVHDRFDLIGMIGIDANDDVIVGRGAIAIAIDLPKDG